MKLARKLTLWLVLGISAVLAVHFVLSVRREQAFFRAESQRHNQLLGRTLVAIVAEVVRAEGEAPALRLIDRADEHDASVSFRWVLLDPREGEQHRPEIRRDRLRAVAEGHEIVELQRIGEADRLLTYAPFRLSSGRPAAIEVGQSLVEKQRYLTKTLVTSVFTTLALALVAVGVAITAGVTVVGRPIRALAAKARRIGEGYLGGPLELSQDDELGALALEMNGMCDRLAQSQAQLARETSARIAALEQLRHAERLAVVGKLASGLAHELGTPLQVVSGWAKMIREREIVGDDALAAADAIAAQSDRMAKSIRGLLDFARRRDPQKQRVVVLDLVRETTALLAPLAEKGGVELRMESDADTLEVEGDAGQLQQALTNLVVNGVDAAGRGTVTIRVDDATESRPPDIVCITS